MSEKQQRTVFYVSDGTGITAETLGHSVLCQFPNIQFQQVVLPYIDSEARAHDAVAKINAAAAKDGVAPFVFDTLVNLDIRNIINTAKAFNLDVFEGLINKISQELDMQPVPLVGNSHSKVDSAGYKARIAAIHFALENDDGGRVRHYDLADVILIGPSRSGKTPTCIYLAMQFGIRAANYPITEDDIDDNSLPKALREHKNKLFGLLIDPDRLAAIRSERKPDSRYASHQQCQMEVRAVQGIYIQEGIHYLDISEMSVEEIATRILQDTGLARRIG